MTLRSNIRYIVDLFYQGYYSAAIDTLFDYFFDFKLYCVFRSYMAKSQYVVEEINDISYYLDPQDCGISRDLLLFGERESTERKILLSEHDQILENKKKAIAIEIGANKGYYAFPLAKSYPDKLIVHAIEPDPRNNVALLEGAKRNNYKNINFYQGAIGGENKINSLKLSNHSNCNTLSNDDKIMRHKYTGEKIHTYELTLEEYMKQYSIDIGEITYIRMDIEGVEYEVIINSKKIFEKLNDVVIFMELHPHRKSGREMIEILEFLIDSGYMICHASSREQILDSPDDIKKCLRSEGKKDAIDVIFKK